MLWLVVNRMNLSYKDNKFYAKNKTLLKKLEIDIYRKMVFFPEMREAMEELFNKEFMENCDFPDVVKMSEVAEQNSDIEEITLEDGLVTIRGEGGCYETQYH